jgi:hypothetical protein
MTAVDDLTSAPDLYEVPVTDADREGFRVDVLGKAVWASRKLRDVQLRRREIAAVVAAEVERAQAWGAARDEALARDAAFFEHLLTDYALWVREQSGGRQKSVSTPYATIRTTTVGGGWEVDTDMAITWALAHRPELVKVEERFALGDAKRALTATDDGQVIDTSSGEVVPGIRVKPGALTAKVTVDMSEVQS